MRLIDADALWMDVIRSVDYCDDILEFIERQPTVEQSHWIPCSERLPENSHDVLIQYHVGKELHSADIVKMVEESLFFDDRVFETPHFAIGCYIEGDDNEFCWLCGEDEIPEGYYIDAWQPLPSPYREEVDE